MEVKIMREVTISSFQCATSWWQLKRLVICVASVGLCLISVAHVHAASGTWVGLSSATWQDDSNWTGVSFPNGNAQTATFNSSGNGNTNINLDGGAVTLANFGGIGLLFDTPGVSSYTVSNGTINTFQGGTIVRMNPSVMNRQVVSATIVTDSQAINFTTESVLNYSLVAGLTVGNLSVTPGATLTGSVTYAFRGPGDIMVRGAITDDNSLGGVRQVAVANHRSGTLVLSGANVLSGVFNSFDTVQNLSGGLGGTLVLDYSGGNTVLTNESIVGPGRNGSGNLVLKGNTTGTTSLSLGSTQRFAIGYTTITVDRNGGDGTTLVLGSNWRGWNTTGGGRMSLFDLSSGGQVQVVGTIAGGYSVSRGIIRSSDGRSSVLVKGTDGKTYYATNDASGFIVAQTNLITLPTSGSGDFNLNYQVTADTTLTGSGQFAGNTLRLEGASPNQTLDLGGRSWNGAGALLLDGAENVTLSNYTNLTPSSGVIVMGPGKLTLGGSRSASADFEKWGPGLLEVTGNHSGSTGPTFIWGGTYRASSSNALSAGLLTLSDGVLELGFNFTRALGTGSGQVRARDDGFGSNLGASFGFSAYGGDRTVNLGGASATITFGAGGFVASRDARFLLSTPMSDSMVDFQNPLNLANDHQTIEVRNGSAAVDAMLSGLITNGGLIKAGPGTLALSANNTYGLGTVVGAGVLLANNGTGSVGTGTTVVVSGATLGGTGVVGGAVVNLGTVAPGTSAGRLSVQGAYEQRGGATLAVEIADSSTHDVLAVAGTATLAGTLTVTTNGFTPVAGNSFTVLTASAVSGTFDTTNVPPLGGSLSWTVTYNPTEVILGIEAGGESPVFGVSPASYDFGGVQVGVSSSVTFVVTNSGTVLLTGTAAVGGTPYAVTAGASYSVTAGGSSNVVITFTPSLAETYSDSVVFLSDGGSATNALTGYGFIIASSTNTSISQSGGLITLNFSMVSGALYRVEATTNLLIGASWNNITHQLTNRTGSLLNFSDTNAVANPMRAYRIVSP
jgi:autotransporter-associated beta strand protein